MYRSAIVARRKRVSFAAPEQQLSNTTPTTRRGSLGGPVHRPYRVRTHRPRGDDSHAALAESGRTSHGRRCRHSGREERTTTTMPCREWGRPPGEESEPKFADPSGWHSREIGSTGEGSEPKFADPSSTYEILPHAQVIAAEESAGSSSGTAHLLSTICHHHNIHHTNVNQLSNP